MSQRIPLPVREAVCTAYREGWPLRDICRHYGVSVATLHKIRIEFGAPPRPLGAPRGNRNRSGKSIG